VPYRNGLQNHTFQQDNARLHTEAITKQFFDRIQVTLLPWRYYFHDLSPIEHVNIGNLQRSPNTLVGGRRRIQEAWDKYPNEAILSRLGTLHYAPLVKIVNYQQRVTINPTLRT
jgi:hypothetical protein